MDGAGVIAQLSRDEPGPRPPRRGSAAPPTPPTRVPGRERGPTRVAAGGAGRGGRAPARVARGLGAGGCGVGVRGTSGQGATCGGLSPEGAARARASGDTEQRGEPPGRGLGGGPSPCCPRCGGADAAQPPPGLRPRLRTHGVLSAPGPGGGLRVGSGGTGLMFPPSPPQGPRGWRWGRSHGAGGCCGRCSAACARGTPIRRPAPPCCHPTSPAPRSGAWGGGTGQGCPGRLWDPGCPQPPAPSSGARRRAEGAVGGRGQAVEP